MAHCREFPAIIWVNREHLVGEREGGKGGRREGGEGGGEGRGGRGGRGGEGREGREITRNHVVIIRIILSLADYSS